MSCLVINTTTGACSQYSPWPFIGMGQFGEDFLLAGPGGLYVHDGEDDDSTPITAEMVTGVTDCGTAERRSPTLKRSRSATVTGRGDGPVEFLLFQEDEAEPIAVPIPNMGAYSSRTITLPRGTRATHWRFGVRNVDGCDFNIGEIEVEMELLTRRGR